MNWQIKIRDVGYKTTRDLYIFRRAFNGETEVMQPDGTIQKFKEGEAANVKPLLELEPEMLQELADELAHNGYRPQKGFLEGKLEATTNHLKDMRTLLKLTKPL